MVQLSIDEGERASSAPQCGPEQGGYSGRAAPLVALSLGVALVQLDVSIVNVGLDQMRGLMHDGVTGLQWVVNGYTLAFASLLLTGGALGDRFGARRIYLLGMGLFTLASLACGIASTGSFVIASRVLQGLGAAMLMPCSLALLVHAYPDERERAKAIGIWGSAGGLAMVAGPVMGGILISFFGWRSIFLINLPIGGIAVWLTMRYAVETQERHNRGIDLAGQILAVVALAALTGAIIESGPLGLGHPAVITAICVFSIASISFVAVEMRMQTPMLPLGLFCSPIFSGAAFIGFVLNSGFYGTLFLLSLYFQDSLKMSPLVAGLAFLPMMGLIALTNIVSGRIAVRWGNRLPITLGLGLTTMGFVGLATRLSIEADYRSIWWALPLIGLGTALTVPPMIGALLATVEKKHAGIASGVLNALRQTGGAIGVAVFGVLGAGAASIDGMRQAMLVAAVATLLAMFVALLCIRPSRN
ncbi:MFS transporter [Phyllobacterium myrsinacearum]|uniref:DHA2 family methylenomycin A resistance protein-like MFS transporter n=1 Tax=Phyllobacterium myrsinacearum TaxID=28101 RepID=A0A839ELP7_9HYPH|nr:MFS transporter [Phyllobacterium myrsinacearum]MBA8879135.1 DHA2 family methylenomycin A resistance protein-like MFS transporter [Phyllobacterium myrsinacearum]